MPWSRWWVMMFVGIAVVLLGAAFVLPFYHWCTAAAVGFGIPEAVGVWRKNDRYPPLTYIIRRYAPRWFAFPLIYGLFGAVASYWLGGPHPFRMGSLFAVLGWLTNHFTVTYEEAGE